MQSSWLQAAESYVPGGHQEAVPEYTVLSVTRRKKDEQQWMDNFHLLCSQKHPYQCLHMCVNPAGRVHSDHPCPCAIILRTQRKTQVSSLCSANEGRNLWHLVWLRGTADCQQYPGNFFLNRLPSLIHKTMYSADNSFSVQGREATPDLICRTYSIWIKNIFTYWPLAF